MSVTIANAAGFLGDDKTAPRRTVESATVDYLTLEYLAELTLSILAHQRKKDPERGYAADFVDVVADLADSLREQQQLRIISNGGGMNPTACAREIARVLSEAGLADELVGVISGDDLVGRIADLQSNGIDFTNLDTGQSLRELAQPVISANAYLGSSGIIAALEESARIVVTGRVADAALTIGPASFEHGWATDDWDCLAGAGIAGHVIECGAQATGGYSVDWSRYNLIDIGYPIAEIAADGSSVITKPTDSGGVVDRRTVTEQLVYEIGDPTRYLTPDVTIDFTSVLLEEIAADRVALRGGHGQPAPDTLKVSLAYHDGYMASGQLLVHGRDCRAKAEATGQLLLSRVERAGFELHRTHIELLGADQGVPLDQEERDTGAASELMLRVSVHDTRREAVQVFCEQLAPLITSGPAGLAGYASGRPRPRPVYAFWPTLVPRDAIQQTVRVRSAREWLEGVSP